MYHWQSPDFRDPRLFSGQGGPESGNSFYAHNIITTSEVLALLDEKFVYGTYTSSLVHHHPLRTCVLEMDNMRPHASGLGRCCMHSVSLNPLDSPIFLVFIDHIVPPRHLAFTTDSLCRINLAIPFL